MHEPTKPAVDDHQHTPRQEIIDRHKPMLSEVEGTISDAMLDGTIDNPRLRALLKELDEESEQRRIAASLRALASNASCVGQQVQTALIDLLCLRRDSHRTEFATLQMHAIGIYRVLRSQLRARRGWTLDLKALRTVPMTTLAALTQEIPAPPFHHHQHHIQLACPAAVQAFSLQVFDQIRNRTPMDQQWTDESGQVVVQINREQTEAWADLSPQERAERENELRQDRIRSAFFHDVFLNWFAEDHFDPEWSQVWPTLADWFRAQYDTPQLFTFLQGHSPEQKAWRSAQLIHKMIQLAEIYRRVDKTRTESPQLVAGLATRAALSVLARERIAPLQVDHNVIANILAHPLEPFAHWVQQRVKSEDFVLPPEPRRRV